MKKIVIENNCYMYLDQDRRKILLNCNDYLENRSRIPLLCAENGLTVSALILELFRTHNRLFEANGENEENNSLKYLLLDVLVISYLIKTSLPINVLELGCVNGILSYHLATLLGKFNEESSLCCVCDVIGNDSGNGWLDQIALVEEKPRISMLAADYEDTKLQEEQFNIVIINGTVGFENPSAVLHEAERLTERDGVILCFSDNQPLLEDCFRLLFTEREEYGLTPEFNILETKHNGNSWTEKPEHTWIDEIKQYVMELDSMLQEVSNPDKAILWNYGSIMGRYADIAVTKRNPEIKAKLLDIKEALINFVLSGTKQDQDFYRKELSDGVLRFRTGI